MSRMSHASAGWGLESDLLTDDPKAVAPAPAAVPALRPAGLWKYRTPRRSRGLLAVATLFSVGLHAFVLLGFNERRAAPKPVRAAAETIIQLTLPDLPEEEVEPVETLEEEAPVNPGINVPMLADLPSVVPIDAFVQPLDLTPALPAKIDAGQLSAIPVNVARSGRVTEQLGKIFDVAQLDRQPEPTFRPSPVFPPELKKDYPTAAVTLIFIITTKGEVVAPQVVAAEHSRFADAAIRAIEKWRFRPGYKTGRPVNTRTQISILFRVDEEK